MSLLLLLHSLELLVVELLELRGSALIRLDVNDVINSELILTMYDMITILVKMLIYSNI